MSTDAPNPNPHKTGGLWGRLFGVQEANDQETDDVDENLEGESAETEASPESQPKLPQGDEPHVDETAADSPPPPEAPLADEPPVAEMPNLELGEADAEAIAATFELESPPLASPAPPDAVPEAEAQVYEAPAEIEETEVAEGAVEAAPVVQQCPACGAERQGDAQYCGDCGWMFNAPEPAAAGAAAPAAAAVSPAPEHTPPAFPLKDRFQIQALVSEKAGVSRYRGMDLQNGQKPVTIVAAAVAAPPPAAVEEEDTAPADDELDDFLPTFDEPAEVTEVLTEGAEWPSVAWEKNLLEAADHPALPKVIDYFTEGEFEYLVEEQPQGQLLWDAWDDPENTIGARYGLLIQLAEGLQKLHLAGAIVEGLRPDIVIVNNDGQPVIADLSNILPIPLPPNPPIKGTLYTAPELMLSPDSADARADIYSFGAMLYSLEYLHHPLEEKDFERQFHPHMITDRYPDVHPGFNRLIIKTFCRDLNLRFPTDEASRTDPTGFTELIDNLKVCQRAFERVRLDVAAWTTTGIVRTGNEDAFAFLHAVESRIDDVYEYALILLADGMGGYEAGEVAAAMAIQELRLYLLEQPMFAALSGKQAPEGAFDVDKCKKIFYEALKHANKQVYTASRTPGQGKRGMGCTAEVVYVDNHNIVVGHVGDSRTYHLTNGQIHQLTRDQTLVNRLVELGQLTPEEAENHDRKNELQQAIGGQPNVEPGVYDAKIGLGDWVLVCSDGITGHIPDSDLEKMLLRETNSSAEEAARRLVNLVNLRGATDNSTVVLVRAS